MLRFLFRSAVATAVLAGASKAWSRWSPSLFAGAVIRVVGGTAQCVKGGLSTAALRAVERVLSDGGVTEAKITLTRAGTVRFSSSIPESEHQRLRNIVLNA
jgi:hypothetical protein